MKAVLRRPRRSCVAKRDRQKYEKKKKREFSERKLIQREQGRRTPALWWVCTAHAPMEQWKLYGAIYADIEPSVAIDATRVGVSATAEEMLRGTPKTFEKKERSQTLSIMDFNRMQPGVGISSPSGPTSQRRLFKENKIVFSEIVRDAHKDWNSEFQTYLEMPGT